MTAPAAPLPALAVFDSRPYDRAFLDAANAAAGTIFQPRYLEVALSAATAPLAVGCAAVCGFVHDRFDAEAVRALAAGGTKLVALRCAGFNNVDLAAAARAGITVVRVPAYSPHAVAEHTVALILDAGAEDPPRLEPRARGQLRARRLARPRAPRPHRRRRRHRRDRRGGRDASSAPASA